MALHKFSSVIPFPERALASGDLETSGEETWSPNTDLYVSGEGAVITMELAGIRREDLELSADGQRLRVRGLRGDDSRPGGCNYLAMEIHYGAFEKALDLPAGYDLTQARAVYHNGILRIEVPKRPGPAGDRSITVQ
ncbi:MAG: Hsp20/alpha crystallin family protein [Verrucomicrobia bacterium]|nr:Hsp20/alpha crystallin family protein [Verrucomicrobiota bacterium]